jgi:hypothetical protein
MALIERPLAIRLQTTRRALNGAYRLVDSASFRAAIVFVSFVQEIVSVPIALLRVLQ